MARWISACSRAAMSAPMVSAVRSTAFGSHLQIREQFHLPPPLIEGNLLAHRGQHPPHAGREFGFLYIQLDIGRGLTGMTMPEGGGVELRLDLRSEPLFWAASGEAALRSSSSLSAAPLKITLGIRPVRLA